MTLPLAMPQNRPQFAPLDAVPKRVLVVPLRYIGDTVLTVPLLRQLRAAWPDTTLDVLVSATTAPILASCPYVTGLHVESTLPKGYWGLVQWLAAQRYEAVLLLRKSVTLALACKVAGIPVVVGYDKQRFMPPWHYQRWGWFLDRKVRYPSLKTTTHQTLHHLAFLDALGLPRQADTSLALWPTPDDQAAVARALVPVLPTVHTKIAVVHVASASHGKTVPLDRFVPSVVWLLTQNMTVILTGTSADAAGNQQLIDQLPQAQGCYNWAGQLALPQTVALLQRAQLLLTVDSSPLHLGAAAGVPQIVGVFGPTNHQQWGVIQPGVSFTPVFLDLPCRPCYAKVCSHNRCKLDLPSAQILSAVQQILPQRIANSDGS
jgi:ADP-heptose:LPS heptosyltransferase